MNTSKRVHFVVAKITYPKLDPHTQNTYLSPIRPFSLPGPTQNRYKMPETVLDRKPHSLEMPLAIVFTFDWEAVERRLG